MIFLWLYNIKLGMSNPKLDTRISFVRLFGLDWRALVDLCPPNIGKLRGEHFFFFGEKISFVKKKYFENGAL